MSVIPADAGIHAPNESNDVDPRLSGDDGKGWPSLRLD